MCVKIIISLCIDYNIKAENIQENMLSMGKYIREFQKTKQKVEETREENMRLEKEIRELNLQLSSIRTLYDGYKNFANTMVIGGSVPGSVLVEEMLVLQEKIKELRTKGERQELKYSQTYGRKNEYKAMYWGAESEYKEYRKESEKTIKKWKEEAEMEKNQRLKLSIDNHVRGEEGERLEVRVENLMEEYNKLSKTHEEEKNALNKIMMT